ncbi:MAG: uL15 family ribosomal protein [archaeon]
MKSKTKIEKQTKKKHNPELVETIRLAKKSKAWLKVASILSSSRKNKIQINLNEIKEDVVVPGKVLSQGEIGKTKVVAFSFSEKAKEKIVKAGGKTINILDEIKSNPEMKGLKILLK